MGDPLVAWNHPESLARLRRAELGPQFFALTNHFESEINKFYCAVCSAVIVLNALRSGRSDIPKPSDPSLFPGSSAHLPEGVSPVFRRYTQGTFLNERTEVIKGREAILGRCPRAGSPAEAFAQRGFQLAELAAVLTDYGLRCGVRHAEEGVLSEDFRRELVRALRKPGSYVIVNYSRVPLEQGRGSHMSPLAAFDEASDSFLVLDVNAAVAPWAWVPFGRLFKAMQTFDTVANRGYLTVEEGLDHL